MSIGMFVHVGAYVCVHVYIQVNRKLCLVKPPPRIICSYTFLHISGSHDVNTQTHHHSPAPPYIDTVCPGSTLINVDAVCCLCSYTHMICTHKCTHICSTCAYCKQWLVTSAHECCIRCAATARSSDRCRYVLRCME